MGGLRSLLGPLRAVLGRSKGLCGWSWVAPRASVNAPGPLSGPLWAVLGRLGVFVGGSGPSWIRSWVLCWRSWAALEACVGGLGRSRGLCWRSCAALGAYVGGLGSLLGPMLAIILGRSRDLCWRSLGARNAPQAPNAGLDAKDAKDPIALRAQYPFFLEMCDLHTLCAKICATYIYIYAISAPTDMPCDPPHIICLLLLLRTSLKNISKMNVLRVLDARQLMQLGKKAVF